MEIVLRLYSKNYCQLTPSTPLVSKNLFVGYFVALLKKKINYSHSHISCHSSCGQEQSRDNANTEKRGRFKQQLDRSESSNLQSWLLSLVACMV